jgi:hypothetical protein
MKRTLCRFISRNIATSVIAAVGLVVLAPAWAGDAGKPAGDAGRGVKLWSDVCARCHNMRDPREFRDDQWQVIVSHMRVRAGLTGQDARDMLAFLQASN